MDSVQTQTFSIRGNDDAMAYIDFCDGNLCVSVVVEDVYKRQESDRMLLEKRVYKLHERGRAGVYR